jgi:glucose-1-phosphate thymidylyltransferase
MRSLVGLIAAGGRAARLAPLPCSKELLPVGYRRRPGDGAIRPKVASHYLIEKMSAAGASRAYVVVRPGKWDILEYYGDGSAFGIDLAYLVGDEPLGPPFTLDHAYPFVRDATVLFGFPDILFQPQDAFSSAVERLAETGADVVVGAFARNPEELFDVVDADPAGRVRRLAYDKPVVNRAQTEGRSWVFAVWGPAFTEFLHAEVGRLRARVENGAAAERREWPVGHFIDEAIDAGLHVNTVFFPGAAYTDIGEPERLARALRFPGVWDGLGEEPSQT